MIWSFSPDILCGCGAMEKTLHVQNACIIMRSVCFNIPQCNAKLSGCANAKMRSRLFGSTLSNQVKSDQVALILWLSPIITLFPYCSAFSIIFSHSFRPTGRFFTALHTSSRLHVSLVRGRKDAAGPCQSQKEPITLSCLGILRETFPQRGLP